MLLKIKANKKIIISATAFLGLSCFYLILLNFSVYSVSANWESPGPNPPPQDNIPRPLNISTLFSGDLISGSSYNPSSNGVILNFKSCGDGQAFVYSNEGDGNWECGDIQTDDPTLLSVLTAGSDASSFTNGVTIGNIEADKDDEKGWMNIGGPLTTNWLHATSTSGISRINHDLEVLGDGYFGGVLEVSGVGYFYDHLEVSNTVYANWINATADTGLSYFNHSLAVLINSDLDHVDVENFSFYIHNDASGPIIALQGDVANEYQGISIRSGIDDDKEEWFIGSNDSNNFVVRRDDKNYLEIDKNNGNTAFDKKVTAEDFCLKDGKCFSFGKSFLGLTSSTYSGNVGGYDEANKKCKTDFSNSEAYVCTIEDILYFINKRIAINTSEVAWISGGPPGFTADANDCGGWKQTVSLGRVWDFSNERGVMTDCRQDMKFACCK